MVLLFGIVNTRLTFFNKFASTVMEKGMSLRIGSVKMRFDPKLIDNKIMTLPKSETIENYIEKSLVSMEFSTSGYNIETSHDGTHLLVNNVALDTGEVRRCIFRHHGNKK